MNLPQRRPPAALTELKLWLFMSYRLEAIIYRNAMRDYRTAEAKAEASRSARRTARKARQKWAEYLEAKRAEARA